MNPPEVVSMKPCPPVSAFKERPILFSAPMVRALLNDTKTQTRRALRVQPPPETHSFHIYHHPDPRPHHWAMDGDSLLNFAVPCPYGSVGERLYVRETWQHSNFPLGPFDEDCSVFYRADYMDDPHGPDGEKSPEGRYRSWKPAIHMPRAASRIDLEVTGVRVERLHDISREDAKAEGCKHGDTCDHVRLSCADIGCLGPDYRVGYRKLWEQINGAGSWNANPWVWCVSFRRIRP